MQKRLIVLFSGRVQGVGFRWTTRSLAGGFPVAGFVRNMIDGRVELVAEGNIQDCEEFLRAVQERMDSNIRDNEIAWAEATGEFGDFSIAH